MNNGGLIMNEYDGVITKPEMEDLFIEHGLHKYIDKYLGKNGKWIYRYKQKITDLKGRYRTRNGGRTNIGLEERENERGYSSSRSRGDQIYGSRNAKNGWSFSAPVKGLSDRGNSRSYSEQGVNRGIAAGRARVRKKNAKRGMSAASRLLERQTAKTKRKNKFQYVITNNHGKEVSVAGLDLENLYSAHGRSRTGQRGSRLNEGIAAGRKRAKKKK